MYEKQELENKIVEFLKKEEEPSNISFVAINLGISFGTAKKVLRQLVKNQKVVPIETSRCTLFAI